LESNAAPANRARLILLEEDDGPTLERVLDRKHVSPRTTPAKPSSAVL